MAGRGLPNGSARLRMGVCKHEQENYEDRFVHGLDGRGGFRPVDLQMCHMRLLNIAVRSDSAEQDERSFRQKKGTIRANCGIVLKVSEL
jgi:hypothetical protein